MSTSTPLPKQRLSVLDGLRGYAIVLVVSSHAWVLAPTGDVSLEPFDTLLSSGNFAVTIFFVIGGFLATRGMLSEVERTGTLRFGVGFLRRWVRISAHVYPLVLVILVLTALDPTMLNSYQSTSTRESAWAIVTYTWNGYVRQHPLDARPDLGHLWYLGTDLWTIGLILVLVFLLRRTRIGLLLVLLAVTLVVAVYRDYVFQNEGLYPALTRVQTRADGLLWGAIAAVVLPWLGALRPFATRIGVASFLLLVPLAFAVNDAERYFGWAGVALNLTMVAFVCAAALHRPAAVMEGVVGWWPWAVLGRASLVIYVWHYPVFWYVSRAVPEWQWGWRLLVGVLATAAVAVIAQRAIERPLIVWLASARWRALDHGLLPALQEWLRAAAHQARSRWDEQRQRGRAGG